MDNNDSFIMQSIKSLQEQMSNLNTAILKLTSNLDLTENASL